MRTNIIKFTGLFITSSIITWLFYSYQVTFTFDSAHYTYLSRIIETQNWVEWDPIRGIVFPLIIYLSNTILGANQTAIMVPMIICLLLLYIISVYFVIQSIDFGYKRILPVIIMSFILIFIIMDPLIQGYFHTLLTEYVAATLGIVSCFFAYLLITINQNRLTRREFFIYFYFIFAVPFAWHLKQPYVGTVLFPFLIAFILVLKSKNILKIHRMFILGLSTALALVLSIIGWRSFLTTAGMPPKPNRELTTFINNEIERINSKAQNPISVIKFKIQNFFVFANIYYYDFANDTVVIKISLIRSNENYAIGYRMYELNGDMENIFPMSEVLYDAVEKYSSGYSGPKWLNNIQRHRIPASNFIFSVTSVLSPGFIVFGLKMRKTFVRGSSVIILCSGSAFINLLAHAIFVYPPLDRYIFWGYPLNMVSLSITILYIYKKIGNQKSP